MNRIMMVVLGAAGITLLGGFAAEANEWTSGKSCHRGMNAEKVETFVNYRVESALDDLGATDAQRQDLLEIKDELMDSAKALHQEKQDTREVVMQAWEAEDMDRAALHNLVDERLATVTVFAHQVADAFADVHDILNADQRAQLSEKAQAHRDARRGGAH